jgi:peptide/nickel transport system permease protein
MGNSDLRTLLLHVVPNSAPQMIALATSLFGIALLAESALSFLGLGVAPPQPTWGGMLADARAYLDKAIWLAVFPGLAISLSLFGINLVGDAVRDRLDPRS